MGDTEVTDPACDPNNPIRISFDEVKDAEQTIKGGVVRTPCIRSHLANTTGVDLYIKKDFLQFTGSFKERGARYSLLKLSAENKQRGVIAASAGNHAQGISYHGKLLGVPVTVVMPTVAPVMKIQKCKKFGANVVVEGKDMAEAKAIALKMGRDKGLTYINGYDHRHILAGQGTMGIEIMEDVPDAYAVIVPIGGGGLIAGVSTAVKAISPQTLVIGAESEKSPGFANALANGKPTYTTTLPSLADGLAVPVVGVNAFETAKYNIDKMIVVKEELVAMAILALIELEKSVVEGAGATSLAAVLSGDLPDLKGKKVVCVLSGGNIDTTILGRCLERGLAALGRLIKFSVKVSDRPGGLTDLLDKLTTLGVSIKDISHERAWVISDVFSVEVKVTCETRNIDHAMELKNMLQENYKNVDFTYFPNVCTAKALGI